MANIRAQEDANRRLGIAENARFIQDTKQGPQGFETAFMTPYGFVGGRRVESDGATTVGRGGTPGANAGTTVSAPPADPNAFVSYNPAAGRHQVNPQPAAAAPASGVAPTTPPQAATPAQPRDNSVAADVGRAARETAATVVNPRVRSSTGGTASAWNPYENPITAPVTRPVRAAVQTAFDTGRRFLRGFTGN